jgi:hypothetical protein
MRRSQVSSPNADPVFFWSWDIFDLVVKKFSKYHFRIQ